MSSTEIVVHDNDINRINKQCTDFRRTSECRILTSLNVINFNNERFKLSRNLFFTILCLSCGTFSFISIGLLSVSIPEIEKQFGLSGRDSGFISAVLDISTSVCTIVISIMAKNREVLWITGGLFLMSIGCIVFAIPALMGVIVASMLSPSKILSQSLCYINKRDFNNFRTLSLKNNQRALILFNVGFSIVGCGLSAIPLLGPVIIRKYYPTDLRSTRLALFYFCTIAGPAFAYLIGKLFNSIPVNIKGGFTVDSFIGAWWLCFVFGAAICTILTFSMSVVYRCFSDYYPIKEDNDGTKAPKNNMSKTLKSLRRLIRNAPFIFVSLSSPLLQLIITGIGIFLPKYIEDQFGFHGSNAGLVAGACTIPGAILGTFIGGFLIKRLNLNFNGICLFGVIVSLLCASTVPVLLVGCEEPKLVFPGQKAGFLDNHFKNKCDQKCNCKNNTVNSVCIESHNILLSSPCLAGCQSYIDKNGSIEYTDCMCLKDSSIVVKQGSCNLRCSRFYLIITILFVVNTCLFSLYVPITELTLRCIKIKDTVVAMGLQQLAQRLGGQVPGPLLIGWLIDMSCKFWTTLPNNKSAQYCLFYNLYNYRLNVVLITSITLLVVALCFCGALYAKNLEDNKVKT